MIYDKKTGTLEIEWPKDECNLKILYGLRFKSLIINETIFGTQKELLSFIENLCSEVLPRFKDD